MHFIKAYNVCLQVHGSYCRYVSMVFTATIFISHLLNQARAGLEIAFVREVSMRVCVDVCVCVCVCVRPPGHEKLVA